MAKKKSAAPKNTRKKARRWKIPGAKWAKKSRLCAPLRWIGKKTKKKNPLLKWPLRLAFTAAYLAPFAAFFLSLVYSAIAWTYPLEDVSQMPARSEIHDRYGEILKNPQGEEIGFLHGKNRRIVSYDEVPEHFVNALIAQEDKRFRSHGAIDFRSMARVLFRAVTRGKLEGGGTISMQLARNSFALKKSREGILRGVHRKILETFIAIRIESRFEKNEILEHYMNRIFWGGSVRGVEVAAQTYFGKSASALNLEESALLVGIIRAPNKFSPFRHLERAELQRDWVLKKMVENKAITQEEADAAEKRPLQIASPTHLREGSYALDAIRRDLKRILEEENIRDGGLIIETTIDSKIQQLAELAVERRLAQLERTPGYEHPTRARWNGRGDPTYVQGAVVVIDNDSGAVLAIVGGRNANESQFNRALQSRRQVGSLFKPFMFLAAFDQGVTPMSLVSDAPIQANEFPSITEDWNPANSDGKYYRRIPVKRALIESRNTSSIRVAATAGMDEVMAVARSAGFDLDDIPRLPSSYLGAWGASPEVVASAYSIFPNGGTRFRPYYIQAIKDRDGKVLWKNGPIPYRAADEQSAWEVSRILEEVNAHGTARALRTTHGFYAPSGGKTGTTNGPTDGWYAGYTSALTCAVWVGMDDGQTIRRGSSGASLALPIWADIMKGADALPNITNGPIAPNRPLAVEPVEDEIPRAIPVEEIPRAIPVN